MSEYATTWVWVFVVFAGSSMASQSINFEEMEYRFPNLSHNLYQANTGAYQLYKPDPRFKAVQMDCNGVIHSLVRLNMTQNRTCGYCSLMRNVTKAGFAKKSSYECNVCRIPLCRNEYRCFFKYHEIIKHHGLQGPISRAEFKLYTTLSKMNP